MAKTKHNNINDTIEEIFSNAHKKGVMQLNTIGEQSSGRVLNINGREVLHFGTCGYLGLESDIRLKEGMIDAVMKYGTQFPVSRAYVSCSLNNELEDYLSRMYGNPAVVTTSTSLGHIGVIPNIIRDEDAVILDHQVHASVQNAVNILRTRGVTVEMIRHNNLNMLESMIAKLRNQHQKIWYMIDGVFSMYGDFAPIKDLVTLMNKYDQLHLYVDDAHGMSWAGKNGTGYILSEVNLHNKMVLASTLGKAFGVGGGVFVFPEKAMWEKIRQFGGAMGFSHPLSPPMIGAAIASAKIHLSEEIYDMQKDLRTKIEYCNYLLDETGLPLVTRNTSPIFFIGTGLPSIGYNIVKRLLNEGFYVNLAIFPAVPIKNTGIRFAISRNLELNDIKNFVDALKFHYPEALKEEQHTLGEIKKAFKMPYIEEEKNQSLYTSHGIVLQHETSINRINKIEWNSLMGSQGSYDWEGLQFLETVFSQNNKPENNWDFHYYIVRDNGKPVLATFFTNGIWKEDMLAKASASRKIEAKRKEDPYYLTSKAFAMGSMFTEGEHMYLDRSNPNWKEAFSILIKEVSAEHDKSASSYLILRDLNSDDEELKDYFTDQGFAKIDIPEACIVDDLTWENEDEYLNRLSHYSRKNTRKDVFRTIDLFDVEIKQTATPDEIQHYMNLFSNVKRRNFDINVFDYPEKLFSRMSDHSNWEFIVIKLKSDSQRTELPIAVIFAYKSESNNYSPMIMGMNYDYLESHNLYKQALYQIIKRGRELNCKRIYLGLSASFEKKKLGARIIPKVAYVQAKDNYNMELISLMEAVNS
jgi:7-keto-8-aminopelargonate synthetase-like enzyme